jgi:hypothetical protein
MTFLGFNIDRRTGNLTDLQTRAVLEEGIMQQNLFDALIRNRVNLAENFDALPRFVNLFIVKIHCILIQGVLVIVFNPTFNNISDISWRSVFLTGGGNWSTQRKPPTCCKLRTNFIT